MENRNYISSKQLFSMVFFAKLFSVFAVEFGNQAGVMPRNFALLAVLSSAIGFMLGSITIKRASISQLRGRPAAAVSFCFNTAAVITLGLMLKFYLFVYNGSAVLFFAAVIVAVVLFSVKAGIQATARFSGFFLPIAGTVTLIFALSNIGRISGYNIAPELIGFELSGATFGLSFIEGSAFAVLSKHSDGKHLKRWYCYYVAGGCAVGVAIIAFSEMLLPQSSFTAKYLLYAVSVTGANLFFKNFDFVYIILFTVCGIIRMTMLLHAGKGLLGSLPTAKGARKNRRCIAVLSASALFGAAIIIIEFDARVVFAILGLVAVVLLWENRSEG